MKYTLILGVLGVCVSDRTLTYPQRKPKRSIKVRCLVDDVGSQHRKKNKHRKRRKRCVCVYGQFQTRREKDNGRIEIYEYIERKNRLRKRG